MISRGNGRNPQFNAGQVDALMFAQFSAINDVAQDRVRCRRQHAKLDEAVPQKDAVHRGRRRAADVCRWC